LFLKSSAPFDLRGEFPYGLDEDTFALLIIL
jgi:hypothetical protein